MSKQGIVNIRGKEYQTVALRVQMFREKYQDWTLQTEIVDRSDSVVVMRAAILDPAGRLIATGHSEENRKSSPINKTSALENAETSAIGRALAAFGLGGTEFATANEVQIAIAQQSVESQVHNADVKPTSGVLDELDEDAKVRAQLTASLILDAWDAGDEALAFDNYTNALDDLSADEMVAAWKLLEPHPKLRSAMKKMKRENDVKEQVGQQA